MTASRVVLGVTLLAMAAPGARALMGDAAGAVALDGSLRSIGALVDNYDFDPFFGGADHDELSQTLLRLTLVGRPMPALRYELHAVQSVEYATAGTGLGALPVGLVPGDVRYRALDLTADWHRASDHVASLSVDRANVRVGLPAVDVTVGRQAISLATALIWNPLDVFLPFDPRQFDQEYKPGVDAVRLDVPLGAFVGVSAFGVAGRTLTLAGALGGADADDVEATWAGSAVLGRVYATVRGWDLSVQGGKVFAGYQAGGAASGDLGPINVRTEVVLHVEDGSPPLLPGVLPDDVLLVEDGVSAVVGISHRFENSLMLGLEYFRNGAGDGDDLDASLLRFASGGLLSLSDDLVGGLATYEILPILDGEVIGIVAVDDGSVQVQPRLRWSAADEIEVLAGAIVNAGARPTTDAVGLPRLRSEFGTFPDLYYAEVKWYF